MDKYNFNKVSIKSGESKFLNTLSKTKGITLIALVITIVVMLILVSIGLSLALGKNGLVEKSVRGKQEAQKAEEYFKIIEQAGDIVTKGQGEGLSEQEINKRLDEYFAKPEVQKKLEHIQKENGLDNINEVKEKVLRDIGWIAGTPSSTIPPIKDEDRAPMILSMDLAPNIKLAVSQFPENCYVDWGDGVKSKSLQSTQTGIKDVKIYGNFNKASLGLFGQGHNEVWDVSYGKMLSMYPECENININQTTDVTSSDMRDFNASILEIKDWGENNFNEISFAYAQQLTKYATPRERSFENLEYITQLFYGTGVTSINANLLVNAPNLKSALIISDMQSLPNSLFVNCTNLQYVLLGEGMEFQYRSTDLVKNNANLKVFWGDTNIVFNEDSFSNHPELEYIYSTVKGKLSPKVFSKSVKLKKLWLLGENCSLADYMFANKPQLEEVKLTEQWTGNIPENLFKNSTKLAKVDLHGTKFKGEIPANLFATNVNLINLRNCFMGCTNLTGKPPKFWETLPLLKDNKAGWWGIYRGCTRLDLSEIDQNAK